MLTHLSFISHTLIYPLPSSVFLNQTTGTTFSKAHSRATKYYEKNIRFHCIGIFTVVFIYMDIYIDVIRYLGFPRDPRTDTEG